MLPSNESAQILVVSKMFFLVFKKYLFFLEKLSLKFLKI